VVCVNVTIFLQLHYIEGLRQPIIQYTIEACIANVHRQILSQIELYTIAVFKNFNFYYRSDIIV
jgi:hypothetical protein